MTGLSPFEPLAGLITFAGVGFCISRTRPTAVLPRLRSVLLNLDQPPPPPAEVNLPPSIAPSLVVLAFATLSSTTRQVRGGVVLSQPLICCAHIIQLPRFAAGGCRARSCFTTPTSATRWVRGRAVRSQPSLCEACISPRCKSPLLSPGFSLANVTLRLRQTPQLGVSPGQVSSSRQSEHFLGQEVD